MNEETIVIETHRYDWNATGSAYSDGLIDRRTYQWRANDRTYLESVGAYLSKEGSFGSYGAQLNDDGKWYPAHMPADSDKIQLAHESFENPIDAIRWCNLFFS
jgi:hypothetical protein